MTEQQNTDAAMKKVLSVSKEELKRRLEESKDRQKIDARRPDASC